MAADVGGVHRRKFAGFGVDEGEGYTPSTWSMFFSQFPSLGLPRSLNTVDKRQYSLLSKAAFWCAIIPPYLALTRLLVVPT